MIVRKNLFILSIFVFNCFLELISAQSYYHSSFLKKLKKCFDTDNDDKCMEMIVLTERMQSEEYYKGNLKCQTSILGLQTELIKNIYFDRDQYSVSWKTIPFLIKNC